MFQVAARTAILSFIVVFGVAKALRSDRRIRLVLVEPSATGRRVLSAWLGDLGIEVAPFGDPQVARKAAPAVRSYVAQDRDASSGLLQRHHL